MGWIIHGMHYPRDAPSLRHIIHGTHHPYIPPKKPRENKKKEPQGALWDLLPPSRGWGTRLPAAAALEQPDGMNYKGSAECLWSIMCRNLRLGGYVSLNKPKRSGGKSDFLP